MKTKIMNLWSDNLPLIFFRTPSWKYYVISIWKLDVNIYSYFSDNILFLKISINFFQETGTEEAKVAMVMEAVVRKFQSFPMKMLTTEMEAINTGKVKSN